MVLRATPSETPTLNIGAEVTISVAVTVPVLAQAGPYASALQARAGTEALETMELRFEVPEQAAPVEGTHVTISVGNQRIRQNDVVLFSAQIGDGADAFVEGAQMRWSVVPADGGLFDAAGRFVAYRAGKFTVVARGPLTKDGTVRMASARMPVTVLERGLSGSLSLVGRGRFDARYTSDL